MLLLRRTGYILSIGDETNLREKRRKMDRGRFSKRDTYSLIVDY